MSDETITAEPAYCINLPPPRFAPVHAGECRAVVWIDGRQFASGDVLRLVEWDPGRPSGTRETGRSCDVRVTHVMRGGVFGLSPDHVMLSVEHATVSNAAELDDLRKERDALSEAFCDMNDGCVRLEKELATLRAHSAALRTIAEKHPDWWFNDETGDCDGCGVSGSSLYAEGQPGVWVNDCTHAASCWAAPIIAMMEGMVER